MLKQIKKHALHLLCFIECMLCNKKVRKDVADSQSICFVRFDGIGDFILWLDSVPAFQSIYPDKKCTLICSTLIESIAKETNLFDEVISINIKQYKNLDNYKYHKEVRAKLKGFRFDVLINPTFSRNSYLNSIVSAIPAVEKVTVKGDPYCKFAKENKLTDRLYDRILDIDVDLMELRKYENIVRQLGAKDFKCGFTTLPKMSSTINVPKPYFVLQLGSSNSGKSWPAQRFAQISNYLCDKYKWHCCVIGLDKAFGKIFKDNFEGEYTDLIGKTTLLDMIHVIQESEMVIGDDSSGIHIAAFSKVNALAVAGNWEGNRFLPYDTDNNVLNNRIRVIRAKTDCALCHGRFTKGCNDSVAIGNARNCINEVRIHDVIQSL